MITFKEYFNKHGSIIIADFRRFKVGTVLHNGMIGSLSEGEKRIRQPFRVIRIATREEFLAQAPELRASSSDYFYEVTTD